MRSLQLSVQSLLQMSQTKSQDFINHIDNVHMVWLEEIQQVANLMFSRDANSEPELMPKTPSQKKNSRRKRVSFGRQEESQIRRRFSRHRRSNLRGSSVTPFNLIAEETKQDVSTAETSTSTQPKRNTRKNKQTKAAITEDGNRLSQASSDVDGSQLSQTSSDVVDEIQPEMAKDGDEAKQSEADNADIQLCEPDDASQSPGKISTPIVSISASERLSAEQAIQPQPSPVRTAAKIAIANKRRSSRRSSVKVCYSRASLRNRMTKESLRRASQQSMLKKNTPRKGNSSCSSNNEADFSCESVEKMDAIVSETSTADLMVDGSDDFLQTTSNEHPFLARVTRSVAANSPKLAPPSLFTPERNNWHTRTVVTSTQQTPQAKRRSSKSNKRKAPYTTAESPKRFSPPKKSQNVVKPNMRSFLHTVQKNQILMMTPNSFNRTSVIKSFIKHTTPLKVDSKMNMTTVAKERQKLEALKKKQEQEEERMRKLEEEKKKKQEEYKRKRDERLRKVLEAKVKEELREEEKKKKIEQKMAHIDEKNDKRQAAELAKKRLAIKRQDDLEQKRKLEEETKRKKLQLEEEEKRQQELLAKKAKEEELKAKKLAEARKALELKRERERELERERLAAAEREKALALQRELERAAREKERRELEEKKLLEEKRKQEEEQKRLAAEEKADKDRMAAAAAAAKEAANAKTATALNVTMDIERSVMSTPAAKVGGLNVTVAVEKSPQSYTITPKGNNKTLSCSKNPDDYGMDQNSDDSTDDESAPRKPIPSWAEGHNLQQIIMKQYFNPPDLEAFFGIIEPPKLENLFNKNKPRYFKRTSSAVWHSPPNGKTLL
ncbi:inner centromere protein A isoform X1 [Corythoichthys intestinalis]|uniref:inner centromere protein A isoform X1 n=1 Tax=Corythoichthys intestinalis TaxID=161448 RepID=UPI0025A581C0|nr:inner centromere protein A isoform X1 [Corythoichthys intestinalis]XP_057693022.1 inner centromere protein A isoform X1 [Corythoichthys intestinalis]